MDAVVRSLDNKQLGIWHIRRDKLGVFWFGNVMLSVNVIKIVSTAACNEKDEPEPEIRLPGGQIQS